MQAACDWRVDPALAKDSRETLAACEKAWLCSMTSPKKKMQEMTDAEKYAVLGPRFEETLLDHIRSRAKENGGLWTPTAGAIWQAAVNAFDEAMTADFTDAADGPPVEIHHSPRLCANVWHYLMKTNTSAYTKMLEAKEKTGTLGFTLVRAEKAAAGDYS